MTTLEKLRNLRVSPHASIFDVLDILTIHFEREQSIHDNQEPDVTASQPNVTTQPPVDLVGEKIERCKDLATLGWTVDIQMAGHCNFVTIHCEDARELEVKHEGQGKTLSEALDAALAKVEQS